MNNLTPTATDALDYALYICHTRGGSMRNESYNAACADIALFIEAAKERLRNGEGLHDHAVTTES